MVWHLKHLYVGRNHLNITQYIDPKRISYLFVLSKTTVQNKTYIQNRTYYIIVWLYFSGLQGSWIVCCLHLKIKFRSCARRRQWHLSLPLMHSLIKPRLLFSHAGYASWGLSIHQFNKCCLPDVQWYLVHIFR